MPIRQSHQLSPRMASTSPFGQYDNLSLMHRVQERSGPPERYLTAFRGPTGCVGFFFSWIEHAPVEALAEYSGTARCRDRPYGICETRIMTAV